MARITVDDCLKRIPNRFQITLTATYRARQLSQGASPLVEPNRDKFTVIALREVSLGKIGVEVLRRNQPQQIAAPAPAVAPVVPETALMRKGVRYRNDQQRRNNRMKEFAQDAAPLPMKYRQA